MHTVVIPRTQLQSRLFEKFNIISFLIYKFLQSSLADPGLQRRGAKFLKKFSNDLFLGISPKISPLPPKIPSISSKFLMTFFLVIDLFCVLYMICFHRGGANSLLFNKITILPLLFLSRRGGQTPLPISMGGAMAGFAPPPGSATDHATERK